MKTPLSYTLILGAAVFAVWLLLSGHYDPFLLIVGVLCSAGVVYVALRMNVVDEEGVPMIHIGPRIFGYIPWFLLEIWKSNIDATKVILSPSLPINPKLFRVRGLQRTDLGRMIFANSITLTPGTITVAVQGDTFHVHALVGDSAEGMDEGPMNLRVARLEREMMD